MPFRKCEEAKEKVWFQQYYLIEPRANAGGLLFMWLEEANLVVEYEYENLIGCVIQDVEGNLLVFCMIAMVVPLIRRRESSGKNCSIGFVYNLYLE